jgi:hypothetical protein
MAARSLGRGQNIPDNEKCDDQEELIRLRLSPPCANGLVKKSPTVTPSGRVEDERRPEQYGMAPRLLQNSDLGQS